MRLKLSKFIVSVFGSYRFSKIATDKPCDNTQRGAGAESYVDVCRGDLFPRGDEQFFGGICYSFIYVHNHTEVLMKILLICLITLFVVVQTPAMARHNTEHQGAYGDDQEMSGPGAAAADEELDKQESVLADEELNKQKSAVGDDEGLDDSEGYEKEVGDSEGYDKEVGDSEGYDKGLGDSEGYDKEL